MDAPTETFCEECDHMHPASRNGPSWRAMCSKFPRLKGMGFVSRTKWAKDPPFMLCRDVNGGSCVLFQPRRSTQENDDG